MPRPTSSVPEVNSDKPWQAITEPQRLCMRPEWGWELDGVNESPNVLVSGLRCTWCSPQLVTPQYATGMLIANVGDDLTDPASWTKSNYPWLHSRRSPVSLA